MMFLGPVYVGERVEIVAEVTYVGRTSIETRIEIYRRAVQPARAATGRGRLCPVRRARRGRPPPAPGPAAADRDRGRPPPPGAGAGPPGRPPGPPGRGAAIVAASGRPRRLNPGASRPDTPSAAPGTDRPPGRRASRASPTRSRAARTSAPRYPRTPTRRPGDRRSTARSRNSTRGPAARRRIEIVADAVEPLLELDDPAAQRPADLGEPLAEQQHPEPHDQHHLHRAKIGNISLTPLQWDRGVRRERPGSLMDPFSSTTNPQTPGRDLDRTDPPRESRDGDQARGSGGLVFFSEVTA